jgi:hypothetical protein
VGQNIWGGKCATRYAARLAMHLRYQLVRSLLSDSEFKELDVIDHTNFVQRHRAAHVLNNDISEQQRAEQFETSGAL